MIHYEVGVHVVETVVGAGGHVSGTNAEDQIVESVGEGHVSEIVDGGHVVMAAGEDHVL